MKKVLLLAAGALFSAGAFAQRTAEFAKRTVNITPQARLDYSQVLKGTTGTALKPTATNEELSNISVTDTIIPYTIGASRDSGYVFGTNVFGDKGFAERYDITGADSAVQVIGLVTLFDGNVNPSSTNVVNLKVWSKSGMVATTDPNIFYNDFPQTVLDSQSVPVTSLGIYPTGDSAEYFMFTTPTANLSDTFFAGYDMNYTYGNGDTLGLWSSQDNDRTSPFYYVSGTDTIVNVQNAIKFNSPSDTLWEDVGTYYSFGVDLYVFPIVNVTYSATAVNSVTKNNLTFYGSYPNPATDVTNISFSLAQQDNVTVTIMDQAGRTVQKIQQSELPPGNHIIQVQTSDFAAGNYIYLVKTNNGGIASKFTVIK